MEKCSICMENFIQWVQVLDSKVGNVRVTNLAMITGGEIHFLAWINIVLILTYAGGIQNW